MSEESNNQQPEVSIGFVGDKSKLQIEFADGWRIIPEYVIAELGGSENLQKIAPGLKQKTYDEFYLALKSVVQKRQVNDFGKKFISNHFSRKF